MSQSSNPSVGSRLARGTYSVSKWGARAVRGGVVRRVGGPARARVIVLFGLVLALNGADLATVGAVAPQLEKSMGISDTQIGLLSSVSLLVGAIATIPVGLLVDKVKRIPMLSFSIVLWSLASLLSAFAGSYGSLLLTRVLLGVVVATAGPAIASLTGDYFPAKERGQVYAYILGGEIAGQAAGFIICGNVASLIDWRAAFFLLSIPGFFLARELYRTVPEPLRGGQSHLHPGVEDLAAAAAEASARAAIPRDERETTDLRDQVEDLAREAVRRRGVEPDPALVLRTDPRKMNLRDSIRYILSIPTNVLMIISSSLGYFFFAGLSTFALLFVRGHYNIGQTKADLVLGLLLGGALLGTLVSGKLTDSMLRHGQVNGRLWVPAVCYIGAALLLIPGFVSTSLTPAVWFDVAGAALLSAANPPLDAARLDIMPAGLWGRAESVRTFIRSLFQAIAPLVFGGLSDVIGGFFPKEAPIGTHPHAVSHSGANGLEISFLILLVALFAAGFVLLKARDTYPRDIATAAASHQGAD